VILLAAACGGGDDSASTDASKPALNPAVASRLAAASDAIAESLEQGDVCTAAGLADDLSDAVVDAINKGEVPPAFHEELTSRANELVNEVNCPPPTTTEEDDEDRGKGKGKGHKKKDDAVVTFPPDTSTDTFTDTTGGG
jgi:hypothetical protein